jgi:hypothetical protein
MTLWPKITNFIIHPLSALLLSVRKNYLTLTILPAIPHTNAFGIDRIGRQEWEEQKPHQTKSRQIMRSKPARSRRRFSGYVIHNRGIKRKHPHPSPDE